VLLFGSYSFPAAIPNNCEPDACMSCQQQLDFVETGIQPQTQAIIDVTASACTQSEALLLVAADANTCCYMHGEAIQFSIQESSEGGKPVWQFARNAVSPAGA
jgi:hypothetical protein